MKYKDNTFITLEGNKTKLSDYIGKHKILLSMSGIPVVVHVLKKRPN